MDKLIIRRLKIFDIRVLDKMYEQLSEQSKTYFQPGLFKYELRYLSDRPIVLLILRISLIASTIPCIPSIAAWIMPTFSWDSIVAIINGNIVGFAFLKLKTKRRASVGLCVSDRYQNRGIGKKLFVLLLKKAAKKNLALDLYVIEANRIAQKLYVSFGFQYTGTKSIHWQKDKCNVSIEMKCCKFDISNDA